MLYTSINDLPWEIMNENPSSTRGLKQKIYHILFSNKITHNYYIAYIFIILSLFACGAFIWVDFFNYGKLTLLAHDWVKEDAYLTTLRSSLNTGSIPWCWSKPFYHNTPIFLANPEISLTPDILLLPFVTNNVFFILHLLIFYTAGFFGCLKIRKIHGIGLLPFFILWLVFNFNGYIVSHLAVGHYQWTGYFLLPFFFLLLTDMTKESRTIKSHTNAPIYMGLIFGLLFLNGSFHIAIWCSAFMALTSVKIRIMRKDCLISIALGGLLGAERLLPAALVFPGKNSFISGYPSVSVLIESFTKIHRFNFSVLDDVSNYLGWWEYDIYIGFTASVLFSLCILSCLKKTGSQLEFDFLIPIFIMVCMSIGDSYSLISNLNLPFSNIERVSSRFIIMPFIFVLFYIIIFLNIMCISCRTWRLLTILSTPLILYEISMHYYLWNVKSIELSSQLATKPNLQIIKSNDNTYIFSTITGWTVSLITLLIIVLYFLYAKRRRT